MELVQHMFSLSFSPHQSVREWCSKLYISLYHNIPGAYCTFFKPKIKNSKEGPKIAKYPPHRLRLITKSMLFLDNFSTVNRNQAP